MEQHIICPNCGTTAATLTTLAATPPTPEPTDNEVSAFIRSHCQLRTDALVSVADLYSAYESWAAGVGYSPVSAKRFSILISQLPGVERRRTKTARMFTGVALVG